MTLFAEIWGILTPRQRRAILTMQTGVLGAGTVLGGAGVGVAAATAVGDGCSVAVGGGADDGVALDVGPGVDDPHPMSAMPAITARRSVRIPDENSRRVA